MPSSPTTCMVLGKIVFFLYFSMRPYYTCFIVLFCDVSFQAVQNVQKSGKICVLDIDMQGVIQIKKIASLKPVSVFVKPPSIGELEIRLRRRNSESEDNLRARLNAAQQEINYGQYI